MNNNKEFTFRELQLLHNGKLSGKELRDLGSHFREIGKIFSNVADRVWEISPKEFSRPLTQLPKFPSQKEHQGNSQDNN